MSCQIAKTEYWKIMIWLSGTKCCHLAMHYVLPKDWLGPNLHFRFMKNCIHMSPLGSLFIIKSGFKSRAGYDGACTVFKNVVKASFFNFYNSTKMQILFSYPLFSAQLTKKESPKKQTIFLRISALASNMVRMKKWRHIKHT